jgi:hypothetical protein
VVGLSLIVVATASLVLPVEVLGDALNVGIVEVSHAVDMAGRFDIQHRDRSLDRGERALQYTAGVTDARDGLSSAHDFIFNSLADMTMQNSTSQYRLCRTNPRL